MSECACDTCKSACSHKPGWFLPEQIKPLAEHLNLTEKELFDKYLLVDYIKVIDHDLPKELEDSDEIFVLSPGIKNHSTGTNFPSDPRGECIWFEDGKCSIHSVKPFECAAYDHTSSEEESQKRHEYDIPYKWVFHQDYITSLLGQDPEAERSLGFGLIGDSLFGLLSFAKYSMVPQSNELFNSSIFNTSRIDLTGSTYEDIVKKIHEILGDHVLITEISDVDLNSSLVSKDLLVSNSAVTFTGWVKETTKHHCEDTLIHSRSLELKVTMDPDVALEFRKLMNDEKHLMIPDDSVLISPKVI